MGVNKPGNPAPPSRYAENTEGAAQCLPLARRNHPSRSSTTGTPTRGGRASTRTYTPADVVALQGSVVEEATLARRGAEVLWEQLHDMEFVNSLGALTGNMAVQQVRAGLKAIYLSGWQVAGDANLSGHTYPDQSLYPANSVPQVVRRINNALLRADEIAKVEGDTLGRELAGPDRRRR